MGDPLLLWSGRGAGSMTIVMPPSLLASSLLYATVRNSDSVHRPEGY